MDSQIGASYTNIAIFFGDASGRSAQPVQAYEACCSVSAGKDILIDACLNKPALLEAQKSAFSALRELYRPAQEAVR